MGVLTGLIVAIVAMFSYAKIVGSGTAEAKSTIAASSDRELTCAIIKEQSKLLSEVLRRRYTVVGYNYYYNHIILITTADLPPVLPIATTGS